MQAISLGEARSLLLAAQGLVKAERIASGPKAVLDVLEQLSYVQIDSISVIARAHHHTLWNRCHDYHSDSLDTLVNQKHIFEYWSHAAAYLPMSDYRYSLPRKQAIASGQKHWHAKDAKLTKEILARIREQGPLQAKDFEQAKRQASSGWWDWKPAKKALEQLFMEGELMAVKRQGFQKVYDLTERVLPSDINTQCPSTEEYNHYLIRRFLRANALGSAQEMAYLRKGVVGNISQTCKKMLHEGELLQVRCEGKHFYMLANTLASLNACIQSDQLKILSPFDNLHIQRKRLQHFFAFDYQLECYLPAAKRQYGYFSLPILWGDTFAGRMDAKIDRNSKTLIIQHLHIETPRYEDFITAMRPVLQAFLHFNAGHKIEVKRVSNAAHLPAMSKAISRQFIEQVFNRGR
ncbi:MAG: winged helix-turn-helix domain-containing protein [Paraglaciecola sp.]|nr:winged helix-turn-helix domain-containing protein [Paraglaciecola sp.]